MMEETQIRAYVKQSEMLRTWQIESILGSGKKSVVYQIARETETGKTVSALKAVCVMPEPDDVKYLKSIGLTADAIEQKYKRMVAQCRDEITIMQQLQGEAYILNCLDFEEVKAEGRPGAMLMIREEKLTPLKNVLSDAPLNENRIIQIALCVAKALETCHYHQPMPIIHGDVKPDNIFWLRDNIYKLGDFGVSAFLAEADGQRQGGTPDYEAPERRSGTMTPKTDIYALGRTIQRLLEGQQDGTSSSLRRFAALMTAENPEDRPENIRRVIEELEKIQANPSLQWHYRQRESITETQTDSLASRVNRPDEDESVIPEQPQQKIEPLMTEDPQVPDRNTSITDDLDEIVRRQNEEEKRKKRRRLLTIVTVVALVAAAAVGVIHQRRNVQEASIAVLTLEKDPTDYGQMTGLLFWYPKDCGYDGADQHEKLMQEFLLTRILSDSNLPVTQMQSDGQGVYLHLSAANGFSEPIDSCKVVILCGTKTVIVTMTAKDGGCGIFGQNLLFVRLDEVLNQAKDSLVSGQSYELRVYSSRGLLYNMNGTIQ